MTPLSRQARPTRASWLQGLLNDPHKTIEPKPDNMKTTTQNTTTTTNKVPTVPAVLHYFAYDLTKPAEKTAWQDLKARLKAEHKAGTRGHCHNAHHSNDVPCRNDSVPVELELSCLFDNQWNTAPFAESEQGLRVFDFFWNAEFTRKNTARGHWLELSPEATQAHLCPVELHG